MDNPKLYSEVNILAQVAVTKCLNEYAPKLKWKDSGERIIDLGCGDGNVTCVLKKYLPQNYEIFVACDINMKMVEFAKEHHDKENIWFLVQDLEGELADELRGNFDHVFSFFLFHWIQNQEKAFKNTYDLLGKDGECLHLFFGYMPIYHVYDILGRDPKWSTTWLKDVDRFLSPYYNMQEPEKKISHLLNEIGFSSVDVQVQQGSYNLKNAAELKKLIRAVDTHKMPNHVFDDFFKDFVAVAQQIGFIDRSISDVDDLETEIIFKYYIILVHAKKS